MFLFFIAFVSGLLTILSPCIWSILPILLASVRQSRLSALSLSLGVITTYLTLTLSLSYTLLFFTIDQQTLRFIASSILFFLGISMLVSQFNMYIETVISRLTHTFRFGNTFHNDVIGNFLTGASLGILWTPCSGPVMTVIATLAASQIITHQVILIALLYSVGIAIPILILSLSESWFISHHSLLNNHTSTIQRLFGIMTVISAVLMFTNYDKVLQQYILSRIPVPFITNTLESSPAAQTEIERLRALRTNQSIDPYKKLDIYKNINKTDKTISPEPTQKPVYQSSLPYLGSAAEITGITKWFNLPIGTHRQTLAEHKGNVILLDFWAYTCAACLPSIPRKNAMQEEYPQLKIIALHEPSTRDGKSEENVAQAITQYGIEYPVGMDNNFSTWDTYRNTYLPSEYVIDVEGNIRYISIDGNKSEEVEQAIQELLKEAGYL